MIDFLNSNSKGIESEIEKENTGYDNYLLLS